MNKALFQHLVKLFNSGDTSEVADIFSKIILITKSPTGLKMMVQKNLCKLLS